MFSSVPNFLSGILAIIIALTSLSGGLVTGGADRPFTVEFGIEQLEGDPASLGVAGQSEATTSAVMKLLGLISFRLSANGTAARMDVKLNGDPAASFAVQKQDGGWAAVSARRTALWTVRRLPAGFFRISGPARLLKRCCIRPCWRISRPGALRAVSASSPWSRP